MFRPQQGQEVCDYDLNMVKDHLIKVTARLKQGNSSA